MRRREKTSNTTRGNHLSGNVPVSTDPYFGVTAKPKNNLVVANNFGHNKPDIFYDGLGSGNQFRANFCDTSVPARLCD